MFKAIKLIVLYQPEIVAPIVILLVAAAVLAIREKVKSSEKTGKQPTRFNLNDGIRFKPNARTVPALQRLAKRRFACIPEGPRQSVLISKFVSHGIPQSGEEWCTLEFHQFCNVFGELLTVVDDPVVEMEVVLERRVDKSGDRKSNGANHVVE